MRRTRKGPRRYSSLPILFVVRAFCGAGPRVRRNAFDSCSLITTKPCQNGIANCRTHYWSGPDGRVSYMALGLTVLILPTFFWRVAEAFFNDKDEKGAGCSRAQLIRQYTKTRDILDLVGWLTWG